MEDPYQTGMGANTLGFYYKMFSLNVDISLKIRDSLNNVFSSSLLKVHRQIIES